MRAISATALVVLTTLLGGADAIAQTEKQGKILMLGDSVTKGGMPEAVQAPLNELTRGKVAWTLVNAGISGETAQRGKARLAALLDAEKPDVLTVSYGLNDLAQNHTPEQFRTNLLEILETAGNHAPAPKVILLTATPFDDARHSLGKSKSLNDQGGADRVLELKFNATVRTLAAEKGLPLVDLHRRFMTDAEWEKYIRPDGVHLTPEGYTFCGAYLARAFATWYEVEVSRDAKAVKARDGLIARLKKVAAAAKGTDGPEVRKKHLEELDKVWQACPYLPAQGILWHAIYYAGRPAEPVKPPAPTAPDPAESPQTAPQPNPG